MSADQANLIQHLTHDLRQPLSTIESTVFYLDIVLQSADPKLKDHLDRLKDAVALSDAILRDALALSQFLAPKPATVDLDELFEEFAASNFDLHLAAAPVQADYLHLRKMVETICSLFAHGARPGSRVEIDTRLGADDRVRAIVRGAGLQIEADSISLRCLDHFAQANGIQLSVDMKDLGRQEIILEAPAALPVGVDAQPGPSALAASAASGSSAPTALNTL
jgi:signal transduction histidine kinase